jgi:two-component system, sensor histidine kinase
MSTAEPAARIVVLDDDQDSREPFAMFLRLNGFAVDEFATAEETLEAVARAAPSLIVMDIALGGPMDGYEVARRLRASAASKLVRLVALTGYSPSAVKGEGDLFDAVLTKPVDANDLVRVVKSLANGQ